MNTRVEWAVQYRTRHFGVQTSSILTEEQARDYCDALHHPLTANQNTTARVVKRVVTETPWEVVDERA